MVSRRHRSIGQSCPDGHTRYAGAMSKTPHNEPQTALAFEHLADALIQRLDLSLDRRREIVVQLHRERELVLRRLPEYGPTI